MASHRAVAGLMQGLESLLKHRLPARLGGEDVNSNMVKLLASADFKKKDVATQLGLWLYRLAVDANGRNVWNRPPAGSLRAAQPVLPLNLHFLVVSWSPIAALEIAFHAWAMQQLSSHPELDAVQLADPAAVGAEPWQDGERVQVAPEEVPMEDLLRLWDALPMKYSLTSCWVMRTVRVGLDREDGEGLVRTRVFPVGAGVP
jgi:Pvc16 N-terminal domain